MQLDTEQTRAMLTLALSRGVGSTTLHKLIRKFGSPQAAIDAPSAALATLDGIGQTTATKIHTAIAQTQQQGDADRELDDLASADAWLLDFDDPGFPALLKMIPDPPRLLWGRGTLREDDALALAIVGSRNCTHYGREQSARFATGCADAGLTIVSGGAYGVDAAAHQAVLKLAQLGSPARTITVIGSGLAKPYPAPHAKLFDAVVDAGSAVISELPMQTPPRATQFPSRNRIIAGLSLGVLVIEAARRSGALITARLAVEEHGRECMALPGRVDSLASAGCHHLLRQGGASLVTHPDDVLEQLGEAGSTLQAARDARDQQATSDSPASPKTPSLFEQNLTDPQQKIVAAADTPKTLDQLAAATGLAAGPLRTELTMLELRGALQREGSKFVRRR